MSVLKWIDQNAERTLTSILLGGMVLLISLNVFMRYVMNAALSWGEELTLWMFVWFVWLGVSYAFHTGDHVRVTVLRDLFGLRVQLIVDMIVALLVLVFLVGLTVECVKLIRMPVVANQSSVVLQLPIPIFYASAPIGAGLSSIRVLQHLVRTYRSLTAIKH